MACRRMEPRRCCNIGDPWETHFKLKLREISFAHYIVLGVLIVWMVCIKYGRYIAMLYAKYQNDWASKIHAIGEKKFAMLED